MTNLEVARLLVQYTLKHVKEGDLMTAVLILNSIGECLEDIHADNPDFSEGMSPF